MVLSVKFFEGSNVAECPTFEIKLFTLFWRMGLLSLGRLFI